MDTMKPLQWVQHLEPMFRSIYCFHCWCFDDWRNGIHVAWIFTS